MNKKVLKWNFIFQYGYVLTNIFNAFLLLPLYLNNIDAITLGVWLATGNVLAWMTLADPGVGDVLQQKIAELKGQQMFVEVGRTIGSGFLASAIILLISLSVGFVFYFLLDVIIDKNVSHYPNLSSALVISVFATGLSLVSFSISGMNQGLHNAANVAIAGLLANFLFLLVNLLFLYNGYGVLSIALANLARALFLTLYNLISLIYTINRERLHIHLEKTHFKKFIRIFSFTSLSRIIGGVSSNLDIVILARYIPANLITIFEINRRPIKLTQSLIGRHSVALMPLLSHTKGIGDKASINMLISSQFRFYSYAALFASFMFCLLSEDLIAAWISPDNYAGNTIIFLMVANFFFGLLGYFMSNMGYALGDIKKNSIANIIKGIVLAVLLLMVVPEYGIEGALIVSLSSILLIDFSYFTYRVYRLGYVHLSLFKGILSQWAIVIPASLLVGWSSRILIENLLPDNMHLSKLMINAGLFTFFFLGLILLVDVKLRKTVKFLSVKYIMNRFKVA